MVEPAVITEILNATEGLNFTEKTPPSTWNY